MDLNWDKYDIEVWDYYAKNRKGIFFDFVQQIFSCMDGIYGLKRFLTDTIQKCQSRNQIAVEVERLNREKN